MKIKKMHLQPVFTSPNSVTGLPEVAFSSSYYRSKASRFLGKIFPVAAP